MQALCSRLKWAVQSRLSGASRHFEELLSVSLIQALTDSFVRALSGFMQLLQAFPCLWLTQDYVVISLILIALRFQSKFRTLKCISSLALLLHLAHTEKKGVWIYPSLKKALN